MATPEAGASAEITDWSALALSRAVADGTVSCAEIMKAYLDRIERLEPGLGALVSLRPREALLGEARSADAERAAGRWRGWLHGLPQAPKDLTATADIPTTMGSPLLADNRPAADSILVERLRAAGAILIGKTNVPEFGLGSHTYNPVFGTTRNPWDRTRSAGGSSGGAAVALAMRLVPVADGSDMMGSLRNPAGWTGVYGFRPSPGRVPSAGDRELFLGQLATEGPMARTVDDLAALLATLAGYDPRAPLSLDGDGAAFAVPPERGLAGVRIGWLGDLGGLAMEEGVLATCEGALGLLADLGCVVEPARIDFPREAAWEAWTTLRSFLVAGALGPLHARPEARALMKPEAVWEIEAGLRLTGPDVFRASEARSAYYRVLADLTARYDVLALPTAQLFPFDATLPWPGEIAGQGMDTYHRWMEVVIPASLAGLPALAVPAGFGPSGLPVGLQLIGAPRGDAAVLSIGRAYDRAQPFTARRPPES